jgi:hypothetical protein
MNDARYPLFLALIVLIGCGGKGAKTTGTTSADFATLAEKQAFLER